MMRLLRLTTLIFGLLLTSISNAEIVVVVNPANPVETLTNKELVDMYMGRSLYFPDGSLIIRLDQDPESEIRKQFYRSLVNKSVADVNAYWAKLLFTGRATPPQTVGGAKGVLQAVENNRNAIGYIDSSELNDSVKVVGKIN